MTDRRSDLEHQIRTATRALMRLDRIPDPRQWPNETVLLWYFRPERGSETYTFVAVKALNRWYTSARYDAVLSNSQLWERLTANGVLEVWIAAEWSRVDTEEAEQSV